jgi:hypothetical protein
MDQLFDELMLRIDFFKAIDVTHAADTKEHIEAKEDAVIALNAYIDNRIEEAFSRIKIKR